MRVAVIVFSDPSSGSEESLGRVFNALAATHEFKQHGEEVTLLFQGAGTRWPAELAREGHAAHSLFQGVKDKVAGASSGCSDVFGATESVGAAGLDLIRGNDVPGTSGLPSLRDLLAKGYSILTF